jgi:hypothetical protein
MRRGARRASTPRIRRLGGSAFWQHVLAELLYSNAANTSTDALLSEIVACLTAYDFEKNALLYSNGERATIDMSWLRQKKNALSNAAVLNKVITDWASLIKPTVSSTTNSKNIQVVLLTESGDFEVGSVFALDSYTGGKLAKIATGDEIIQLKAKILRMCITRDVYYEIGQPVIIKASCEFGIISDFVVGGDAGYDIEIPRLKQTIHLDVKAFVAYDHRSLLESMRTLYEKYKPPAVVETPPPPIEAEITELLDNPIPLVRATLKKSKPTPREELSKFLAQNNLGIFCDKFIQEDIGLADLPILIDADLNELGFKLVHKARLRQGLSRMQ